MNAQDQAFRRLLEWRARDLGIRAAQAAIVAGPAWLMTHDNAVVAWLAATLAASTLDSQLARYALKRPDTRWLHLACAVSLMLTGWTFSAIALILLVRPTGVLLASAVIVLCAMILNNAVMTRGSRRGFLMLVTPSSSVLMCAPFIAALRSLGQTEIDTVLLTFGAGGFCIFVVRVASFLHAESRGLRAALVEQSRQRELATQASVEADHGRRRWHMAFRQSPLPQVCYRATNLFDLVRPEFEAGERRLGDLILARLSSTGAALERVDLIEANQATNIMLGLPAKHPRLDSSHFPESLLVGVCDSLNRIGDDGVLPPFETRLVRVDGEMVDVQVHGRMPLDQEPAWGVCVVTFVDITAIKRAARAEREAREAAEAADRAKSEFLAVISHEIRTPLNGVLGMAQALERDRLRPDQLERVRVIKRSGAALSDIFDDILDLSKIEAGKLELEAVDFDLADLAARVHATFLGVAQRKELAFDLIVDPSARGRFRGDARRLRQVLGNLVSNAIKFTEAGRVALEVRAADDVATCQITDTGIGISRERLPQLFEKFVQDDSSTTRRYGGAGVGLALCQQLCTAMGGRIWACSEPGVGSAFFVELPLHRRSDPVQPAAARQASSSVRVLAAEDNAVNQMVLTTLLEPLAPELLIVENGAEAVRAWRAGDWDLILMDIQMPVMDGLSAARAIREQEALEGRARTPIIALTANGAAHQVASYRAAGIDNVVGKPIDVAELFRVIGETAGAD